MADSSSDDSNGYSHWGANTWNNPPEDWFLQVCKTGCDYAAGQLEIGESGTLHAQFYMYFAHKTKTRTLSKKLPKCSLFGVNPRLAETKWNYCRKSETAVPDTWKEFGKKPRFLKLDPKNKNSQAYEDTLEHCKNGSWENSCAEHQVKYQGNLSKLTAHYSRAQDTDELRGVWISGAPGTGKSYTARHQFGDSFYVKAQNKWWDAYRGEPTVILDDLDFQGACLSHYLKIWLDRYGNHGEIKGGHVALNYTRFVITSNYLPEDLWPGDENAVLRDAIRRRCRFYRVTGKFPEFSLIQSELKEIEDPWAPALKAFLNK